MTQSLLGKTAYVTGGGKGIGRACAMALAEAGADIAIADLADAGEVMQAIAALGRRAFAMRADMGDVAQINAFAAAAATAIGPCDILLNNAGAGSHREAPAIPQFRDHLALHEEDDVPANAGAGIA